jgi:hypothetical protein
VAFPRAPSHLELHLLQVGIMGGGGGSITVGGISNVSVKSFSISGRTSSFISADFHSNAVNTKARLNAKPILKNVLFFLPKSKWGIFLNSMINNFS